VLDFAHKLTLQSVEKGEGEDTPAMQSLLATGLVGRSDDGGYVLTPAGEAALEEGKSTRMEMRVLWVLCVCLGLLAITGTIDWMT
jgi:hypothetical protein